MDFALDHLSAMSAINTSVVHRTATRADLPRIAQVYLKAFANTLEDLRSPNLSAMAVADIMSACLEAEPECTVVAEVDGAIGDRSAIIVGYVIAVANTGRIPRAALAHGLPLVWLWRWLLGRYGLPWRAVLSLLGDKMRFWQAARGCAVRGAIPPPTRSGRRDLRQADCPARILSLAVDPAQQGRHIGRRLLETGLLRLRRLGCDCVRLEVRPDNQPAVHLYEDSGFQRVGEYRDSRGPWAIMILRQAASGRETGGAGNA
jgi:ribosomal protein S18 acetylase RimI-like enzyme